ncbi:MAG: hypothetical protein K0R03_1002 [Moraxellaceae bacterium]|jgi:hypothetical protein|nr:hypothetical protein [Moraxellaceae bacterium]
MNWQRAPFFLGLSAASALLLLAFVLLLSVQEEASDAPGPVQQVQAREEVRFPPGFGSLANLVPFKGGVAPVATDVVPAVEHGPEYRDAAWVHEQSPESFTIQVLAARDEEAVKRFLAEREDRSQFVYFLYPQGGESWFVVTTGSYPSHELAAGIIDSRDFGGLPAKPFPRRMGAYQDALRVTAPAATESGPID